VITLPLVLLAIPSVVIGLLTVRPVLFGGYFGNAIQVLEHNDVLRELGVAFPGWALFALGALAHPPFWLAAAGVATAWYVFLRNPQIADRMAASLSGVRRLLENKYYFDWFNDKVIAAGSRALGRFFFNTDQILIDEGIVNGSAGVVGTLAAMVRRVQTGYLYSYAFWMVIGLAVLLGWVLVRG
jgi:NADH-quinone oxidoreductase subunit L